MKVKVQSIDTKVENECFYNMFGEAIKLTLKSLAAGNMVVKATVYGIVVATHEYQYARLLNLEINLCCTFYRSPGTTNFTNLFNNVINVLNH